MNAFVYEAVECLAFPQGTRKEKFKLLFNSVNRLSIKELRKMYIDDQSDFLKLPIDVQKRIIEESLNFKHDICSGAIVFRLISCVSFPLEFPQMPYFLLGYIQYLISHNYCILQALWIMRDLIKKGLLPGGEVYLYYTEELWIKYSSCHIYAAVPSAFGIKSSSYVLSEKCPTQK